MSKSYSMSNYHDMLINNELHCYQSQVLIHVISPSNTFLDDYSPHQHASALITMAELRHAVGQFLIVGSEQLLDQMTVFSKLNELYIY